MSEKSSTKADFWSKNQKDMSDDGIKFYYFLSIFFVLDLGKGTFGYFYIVSASRKEI